MGLPKLGAMLTDYLSETTQNRPVSTVLLRLLMEQDDRLRSGKETSWDQTAEFNGKLGAFITADIQSYKKRKARAAEAELKEQAPYIRFSPSSANGCFRRMWFRHYRAPVDTVSVGDTMSSYFMRSLGSSAHLTIQVLLSQAGVLVERERRLVLKSPAVSGFCDGVLDIDGEQYVLEIKTISDNKLRAVQGRPLDYHVTQCRLYQSVIPSPVSLLYLTREHCKVQEHVIDYDKKAVELALQQPRKHERFVRCRLLPSRASNHMGKPPCLWCEFTNVCFTSSMLDTFTATVKAGKGSA